MTARGTDARQASDCDADVVILAFDRVGETLEALRSALAQTGVSRHVWVVDQGSRPDAARAFADAVQGRPDATLVRLGRNLGVPGGRNFGAKLGRARVIAALDNDAEFADSRTLAGAVAALDGDSRLAAVGMRITVHATGRDDLSSWGYPLALLPRSGGAFDAATFVGAGHAIRRAAWDAAGGYDPALFFTWEEHDFCLRAIDLGWRIAYRGDLEIRHKISPELRVGWSGERWFHHVRNRVYIERKWRRPPAALAARAAGYIVKGARNGLLPQTLRGVAAGLRMPVRDARRMSEAGRVYLSRHDGAHRGDALARLGREVLASLPGGEARVEQR